jgi:C1A family cysteine protease
MSDKRVYSLKIVKRPDHVSKYGAVFDISNSSAVHSTLPSVVDLRPGMPPVYDQGQLGSCTANALVGIFQYDDPKFYGSRLFLYYNERVIEHDVGIDAGAQLSDGILSLEKNGVCSETTWPYDTAKFTEKPPVAAYSEALKHKALVVQHIPPLESTVKQVLAKGKPFVVGIQVYSEFESAEVAKTGIVPMPSPTSELLGGHAVVVCGYDHAKQHFICRNSWSESWGDKGYFYLPYPYILNLQLGLSSDMWAIQQTTV